MDRFKRFSLVRERLQVMTREFGSFTFPRIPPDPQLPGQEGDFPARNTTQASGGGNLPGPVAMDWERMSPLENEGGENPQPQPENAPLTVAEEMEIDWERMLKLDEEEEARVKRVENGGKKLKHLGKASGSGESPGKRVRNAGECEKQGGDVAGKATGSGESPGKRVKNAGEEVAGNGENKKSSPAKNDVKEKQVVEVEAPGDVVDSSLATTTTTMKKKKRLTKKSTGAGAGHEDRKNEAEKKMPEDEAEKKKLPENEAEKKKVAGNKAGKKKVAESQAEEVAENEAGARKVADEGEKTKKKKSLQTKKKPEKKKGEEEGLRTADGDLDWDKLMEEEEKEEMRRSKTPVKKVKASSKKSSAKKGGKIAVIDDAQFAFADNFQLSPDFSDYDDEEDEKEDELAAIWRDAHLFIDSSSAKIPDELPTDDCDHDFIFKEDIGKVCVDCGKVGQLVSDTFDIPRLTKRGKLASKRDRTGDISDGEDDPNYNNSEEDRGELTLLESHHRNMHQHQKEGFKFISKNLCGEFPGGCFMHHAPGTGKTYLVISCLQSYFFKYPNRRALISAPKIVLQSWERELKRWEIDPIPTTIVRSESMVTRLEDVTRWFQGNGVLIITPQLLSHIIDGLDDSGDNREIRRMMIQGPHLLVVDEAHFARTAKTRVYNSLKHIKTRQRIFLSGTAFQNNLEELFNLLFLCRPNFLSLCPEFVEFASRSNEGKPKWAFFRREVYDRMEWDKPEAIRKFRALTEPFVQWYDGRVLQSLPGLEEYVLVLRLTEPHMEKLQKSYDSAGKKNVMAVDRWVNRGCIHPCLTEERWLKERQNPWEGVKTALVLELLQFVGKRERVIVFCQLRAPLALLEQMIVEHFGWRAGEEILHIHGNVNEEERQRLADLFNSPRSRARVLLASLKTCGEGISLIGGSRVVILDPAWNPFTIKQAVARAYRYGQTKRVYVYKLLAEGTLEPEKLMNAVDKEFLARALFDPGFDFVAEHNRMEPLAEEEGGGRRDKFLDAFEEKPGYENRCAGIFTVPL